MERTPLYRRIAASIRQEILDGKLRPGDLLPPVRDLAERWGCTPGTVQQAYRELAGQGLAVGRPGQGTRVGSALPPAQPDVAPLRRASLVNQAEAFLLEALSAGYSVADAESALRAAVDRWRALPAETAAPGAPSLRFAGSHDPAVSLLAARFPELCPGYELSVAFTGSLGGLMALAEGKADLAGCHLMDEESGAYNDPFVRRLLPGRRIALVTLAKRRLGLIIPAGNPLGLAGVADLARPGVRFINRQPGAGTRVWLDAHLRRLGVSTADISGYGVETGTHAEVARAVAEGRAAVGLGIESAALAYGLGFVLLATEPYDLVIPADALDRPPVRALLDWLATPAARAAITALGGYDTSATARTVWVE